MKESDKIIASKIWTWYLLHPIHHRSKQKISTNGLNCHVKTRLKRLACNRSALLLRSEFKRKKKKYVFYFLIYQRGVD